ncbi:MAG: hypothetical protein WCS69_05445 [Ignavibacteriaceae bacterium]|jgi:hypothetical protein
MIAGIIADIILIAVIKIESGKHNGKFAGIVAGLMLFGKIIGNF